MQQKGLIQAKAIANKFLEQYHSNVQLKEIVALDCGVYLVTLETGLLEKNIMQIKVDAKTTQIIEVGYLDNCEKITNSILDTMKITKQ